MRPVSSAADNSRALALLCANLPALRSDADRDDWSDALDSALADLRSGRSPVEVLEDLGYESADETWQRGGLGSAGGDVPWSPVAAIGDYRCPRTDQSCRRTAQRDERGHPPQCHFDGKPMRPIAPDQP